MTVEQWEYGLFPGGDPRDFRPDPDTCTDEEIARWYRAYRAADRAEAEGRELDGDCAPGCLLLGDGSAWTGTGLGVGEYRIRGEGTTDDE